jgi:hypothetical protein
VRLGELREVIEGAGGCGNALDYAEALLLKVNRLESTGRYGLLLNQLSRAREPGDFRGRVLEVNFAEQFERNGHELEYGAKQGMNGDIDFRWSIAGRELFIETKLLGQDKRTKEAINADLERYGVSARGVSDDTRDIGRIQLDFMQKASTKKFNPKPDMHWINLIAIDVAELLYDTVDACDCFLAAGGDALARRRCDEAFLRPNVVGVFEVPERLQLTSAQANWLSATQGLTNGAPHPREYIHGVLFLFRNPKETAALSYDLDEILILFSVP